MNIDPKAETSRRFSAYTYALNNPVFFIDPDGMTALPPTEYDAENYGYSMDDVADGETWVDSDGSWAYNKSTSTWEGTGDTDYNVKAKAEELNEVVIEGNGKGTAYGLSVGGAVGGGISLEIGLVQDGTNNWGGYFSFKGNVGIGGGVGVSATEVTPSHDGKFLVDDFGGTSIEGTISVNSPLGGGGVSYGGTSPEAGKSIMDRFSKIGTDKRGYTTGSISPELSGPSAKVSVGATVSKSKTWVWDF